MKTIITAVCLSALTSIGAMAAEQKTGIDVPGCASYVLVDGRVHQLCERDKKTAHFLTEYAFRDPSSKDGGADVAAETESDGSDL